MNYGQDTRLALYFDLAEQLNYSFIKLISFITSLYRPLYIPCMDESVFRLCVNLLIDASVSIIHN